MKKFWVAFVIVGTVWLSLSMVENSFLKKSTENELPFLFVPDSIAIDNTDTLYVCSNRTKQIFAFNLSTMRIKYIFKIQTNGIIRIVGSEENKVLVNLSRESPQIHIYENGKLIKTREPTRNEESSKDKKRDTDKFGNTYTLKNKLGRYYLKVENTNGGEEARYFCSMSKTIQTNLFVTIKLVCAIATLVLFFFNVFQSSMEDKYGEKRFYSLKDFLFGLKN